MSKLLIVDLDGTVRRCKSNPENFISFPEDQEVIPGADKGVENYYQKGWKIIGVSNQGGCSATDPETNKPYKSLGAAIEEQRQTLKMLPQIDNILICPDFKGQEAFWIDREDPVLAIHNNRKWQDLKGTFRKPNPGMLNVTIRIFGFVDDAKDYWYVGDRPEDSQAAQAAGVNFCDAEVWRSRFLPGLHEYQGATPELVEFLEGVKL